MKNLRKFCNFELGTGSIPREAIWVSNVRASKPREIIERSEWINDFTAYADSLTCSRFLSLSIFLTKINVLEVRWKIKFLFTYLCHVLKQIFVWKLHMGIWLIVIKVIGHWQIPFCFLFPFMYTWFIILTIFCIILCWKLIDLIYWLILIIYHFKGLLN